MIGNTKAALVSPWNGILSYFKPCQYNKLKAILLFVFPFSKFNNSNLCHHLLLATFIAEDLHLAKCPLI
jgi:hypothetical protein